MPGRWGYVGRQGYLRLIVNIRYIDIYVYFDRKEKMAVQDLR